MKKTDIKNMTTDELTKKLREEEIALHKITFAEGVTRIKNVKEGRAGKKLIAQLQTELRGRAQA